MLDITDMPELRNEYGGSESKSTYLINNEKYMVKFPDPVRETNNKLSYMNNCYSEYIGCHIFELLNIPVQKTELVLCTHNSKNKVAVACKDFLQENEILIEAKTLFLPLKEEPRYTFGIEDVYDIFNSVSTSETEFENFTRTFWDVFVVDALIGNKDRHLGNWGFIKSNNSYRLSPVYDCGSSLDPLKTESIMKDCLENPSELKNASYNVYSVYTINNKRIFYPDIFMNPPQDLTPSILNIVPKINLTKINEMIDDISTLSNVQKEYYKSTIKLRKELILDKSYSKLVSKEEDYDTDSSSGKSNDDYDIG